MPLFVDGSKPFFQNSWNSEQKQETPQEKNGNFHPTCLCPDCLEAREEDKAFCIDPFAMDSISKEQSYLMFARNVNIQKQR